MLYTYILTFIFGACIGSFLNVCIFRIPNKESIIYPGSKCPSCSAPIRFYDNIPIISYLFLKGRCRGCGAHISFRYIFVEILTGCFSLFLFLKFGFTIEAIINFIFISTLIIITFIDLDHLITPDGIILPGIPIFLVTSSIFLPMITFLDSIAGLFTGSGILFLIALFFKIFMKKDAMGGGDIKLQAMIGAFIGWKGALFGIFAASIFGTVIGFIYILSKFNICWD